MKLYIVALVFTLLVLVPQPTFYIIVVKIMNFFKEKNGIISFTSTRLKADVKKWYNLFYFEKAQF